MIKFASFFGIGFLPKAPGSFGSFFALPIAYLLMGFMGFPVFVLLTIIGFFAGWWACASIERAHEVHDPSWIVIDEVIGQWIALFPVGWAIHTRGMDPLTFLWPGYLVAFLGFRLFDIWKPWIIGWADRRGGPLGVMLDDVFAGVFAAILVMAGAALYHGVIEKAL